MTDKLLRLYHRLPGAGRSAMATVRGLYLRRWRYSSETDALAEQALERESWTRAQWQGWQEERIARLLSRAAELVPHYREHWAERRRRGDESSPERLENWPLLEKESVRNNPMAFVASDRDVRLMFHERTSGTTGKSLDLWWSREMVVQWYALFEARWRKWYDVSRKDRWALLGGQMVAPVAQARPPFWVWNAALNQLYMSSYHLAPGLMAAYLDAMVRYRIVYVLGYASSLYALAREALRLKRRDIRLAVAITNAEPLLDHQRDCVAEAFGCPVRETYGMSEAVAAASECEKGRMHLWPEAGYLETRKAGGAECETAGREPTCGETSAGELISTGLLNFDMPLIRYRVGDLGKLSGVNCDCGRSLPVIASIDGRVDDVLITRDGRRVGRLDPVFKSKAGVNEAQLIQEAIDRVRVRYVPAPDFTAISERSMAERLRARMGDIEVIFERVDSIPRSANGKFRAVVCRMPASERSRYEVERPCAPAILTK
jgi:phenylacetate-CoA ligase